ncbi:endosulfine family protein [Sporobolomyces salmoneus]|uniref:endosulfine family protein n=1 Tax=Sporobolomyces salmoneus TaxID=183962 RepID=UPI00317E867B
MLPGKQKVDISSFSDQEKELFQKYGKVPTHKNLLSNKLKERKYFDSGDYAMSKAGVSPQSSVGTAIPSPADIPHASPPQHNSSGGGNSGGGLSTSPSTSPGSIPIGSPSSSAHQTPAGTGGGGSSPTSQRNVGVGQAVYGSPSKEPITQHRAHH